MVVRVGSGACEGLLVSYRGGFFGDGDAVLVAVYSFGLVEAFCWGEETEAVRFVEVYGYVGNSYSGCR